MAPSITKRSEGTLDRPAFFNYIPHGKSPAKASGVWARSGDWKLIRWFGELTDDVRYELYNLHDGTSNRENARADAGRSYRQG